MKWTVERESRPCPLCVSQCRFILAVGFLWLNGGKQRCSSLSPSLSVPSIWLQGYRQIIGFTQQHLTYTLLTLGLAWPHMDMLPIVTTFLKIGAFWKICDHGNYCNEVWYILFRLCSSCNCVRKYYYTLNFQWYFLQFYTITPVGGNNWLFCIMSEWFVHLLNYYIVGNVC